MPTKNHHLIDLQKYFLIALLSIFLLLLLYAIFPFLGTLVIAAVIVTGAYPLQKKLIHRSPGHPNLMTLLTLFIITLLVLIPFTFLFTLIAREASQAYSLISDNVNQFFTEDFRLLPAKIHESFLGEWLSSIGSYVPINTADLIQNIETAVSAISTFLVSQTTNVLKHFSLILLHLIVFFLSLFYFFRDGKVIIHKIRSLLPLQEKYRGELFVKLGTLSRSIIYGIFGAAIAQGFLAGLGFYFAGISNAVFWGTMMAFFSPVPYIGTAIIWVPTVIYLISQGAFLPAIFLFFWCSIIVGLSDNLVKPYLIGEANAIHPLLVLLVILGGVFAFGLEGVIFGPFLLSLTLTFLHIYQLEYREVLNGKAIRSKN